MKQWIVAALVLALGLMLAGCSTGKVDSQKIAEAEADEQMFVIVYDDLQGVVVIDKQTRVMYWNSGGRMTLLVNPDGTPRIWEV
jgi:hypothetical protein